MDSQSLIAARRYTLEEVDDLRRAITAEYSGEKESFIHYDVGDPHPVTVPFRPAPEAVEYMTRTAMMAGITASEYAAASADDPMKSLQDAGQAFDADTGEGE